MHSESTPRAISRNQSAISMHSESTPHLLTTARLRERMAPNSSKLRTSSVARSAPDEGGPRMQSACTPYAIRGNQHALRGARTHPSDAQRTLNEGGNHHAIRAQSARTHPSDAQRTLNEGGNQHAIRAQSARTHPSDAQRTLQLRRRRCRSRAGRSRAGAHTAQKALEGGAQPR
jgi:hypothetical protein